MKYYSRLLILSILFACLFVNSCKEEEEEINEAQVLIEYLESADSPAGKDYINTDMNSIMTAEAVKTAMATNSIYIIDIRKAEDYDTAHIEGAVNVTLSNLLTHMEENDLSAYDKVAIICYSGQTAAFGTSLLRLSGYDNVFSMKFGMCSWHANFAGSWNNNIGTNPVYIETTANAKGDAGDLPELSTGKTTGLEILDARVNYILTDAEEGFDAAKVTNQMLYDNKDDYYIVNYWPEDEYNDPGHFIGAIQYTPGGSMKLSAGLKTLPTDKKIAVYCYTGQNSAYLTAYLRLIGYDAKSLLFGTNGFMYDDMTKSTWSEAAIMGYEYWTP